MTIEIILVVLVVGIIGLIWPLTLAIFGDDQHAHDAHQGSGVDQSSNPEPTDEAPLSHRTAA
jgi:hypothetical protein